MYMDNSGNLKSRKWSTLQGSVVNLELFFWQELIISILIPAFSILTCDWILSKVCTLFIYVNIGIFFLSINTSGSPHHVSDYACGRNTLQTTLSLHPSNHYYRYVLLPLTTQECSCCSQYRFLNYWCKANIPAAYVIKKVSLLSSVICDHKIKYIFRYMKVLIYLIFYFKLLGFVCLTQLSFSVSSRS